MRSAAVAAVAVVGLLTTFGCAHEFAGTGSAGGVGSQLVGVRAGPVNGMQAALSAKGLYGPNIAVMRGPMFYRGNLMNRVVDLRWSHDRVMGMIDSAPTELNWNAEGDGLRIRGLYAGKLSNLRITSETIEGSVGGCDYHLNADRRGYRGKALCLGSMDQDAEVILPADLYARPEGEQIALVALILAGGAERPLNERARTAELAGPGFDYFWSGGDPMAPGIPYEDLQRGR